MTFFHKTVLWKNLIPLRGLTFFHKIVLWKPYPIKGIAFFHKIVLWKKPYPIRKVAQRRDLAKKLLSPKVSKIGFYILLTSFQKLFQGPRPHTEHFFAKCAYNSKTEGFSKKVVKSKSVLNWIVHTINNFPEVVLGPQAPYWAFFAKCAYY